MLKKKYEYGKFERNDLGGRISTIMKKKYFLLFTVLLLCLTGCKKNKDLEEYRENMESFTENISDITSRMDAIDTGSETAVSELLGCLDELQVQFVLLGEMNVPKEFASVESLADEANEYMTEAVLLYHDVFESEEYSSETASAAKESYDRSMKRISYISSLLKGEIPDGDDIIITEENILDFEPVTEDE